MKFSVFDRPTQDRPMMALGLLLLGVLVLALQDTLVKVASPQTSFWQFQTIRSFFNIILILIIARATLGFQVLRPERPWPVFMRASMLGICMIFFFGAAPQITVAQMAAGLYTYPLFITVMAGPILGEKIGPWRLGALALGAVGSVTVLNPFSDQFKWVQIMPIMAGFFYACNVMILRKYCRNESPLALTFVVGLLFFVLGSSGAIIMTLVQPSATLIEAVPFIFSGWPELTLLVVGLCVLASLLNLTGNICLSRAYQTADSSWLAPLDFSYLLFATVWGKILFDTIPTPLAILGMVMIAAAGIITGIRESLHNKTKI